MSKSSKSSKSSKDDQVAASSDDSLVYEQTPVGVQMDDPLAAIKAMRLEQLAMCRLKTAQEMQAMRNKLENSQGDGTEEG